MINIMKTYQINVDSYRYKYQVSISYNNNIKSINIDENDTIEILKYNSLKEFNIRNEEIYFLYGIFVVYLSTNGSSDSLSKQLLDSRNALQVIQYHEFIWPGLIKLEIDYLFAQNIIIRNYMMYMNGLPNVFNDNPWELSLRGCTEWVTNIYYNVNMSDTSVTLYDQILASLSDLSLKQGILQRLYTYSNMNDQWR